MDALRRCLPSTVVGKSSGCVRTALEPFRATTPVTTERRTRPCPYHLVPARGPPRRNGTPPPARRRRSKDLRCVRSSPRLADHADPDGGPRHQVPDEDVRPPAPSLWTRSECEDQNATYCPSALIEGRRLCHRVPPLGVHAGLDGGPGQGVPDEHVVGTISSPWTRSEALE